VSYQEIHEITLKVIAILQQMGIDYEIGGSLASSIHGVPRSTLDADIVANLHPNQTAEFVKKLGSDFYADAAIIEKAVRERRSFNIIHLGTMLKVDIFAIKDSPFGRVEFSRRVQAHFPDASGPLVWLSSPEDIVLHKLAWYAAGGKVADRQLQDAVGVLRTSRVLDKKYLYIWAASLGVKELLEQALAEASR
jgi:hypothetical protein